MFAGSNTYRSQYPRSVWGKLLTLCGLTSPKTHQGGLRLSGLVYEEKKPIQFSTRASKKE